MSLRARLGSMLPIARYEVAGESMLPEVAPGERVLVRRNAYRRRAPRQGELVVLRDPRDGRLLLKRIERRTDDGRYAVAGANAGASTDSRVFGPVERERIVGKVVLRY